MNKTYVVLGTFGYREDEITDILYAGSDEEKAKGFNVDIDYHTLELQVWMEGIMIKSYSRQDAYMWTLEFDKIKTIKEEIEKREDEKKKLEDELNLFKSISIMEDE